MVKVLLVVLSSLVLGSCTSESVKDRAYSGIDSPEVITKRRLNELVSLPPVDGPKIPIAIYRFPDLTGQRKPATNFASLSSAVTQGADRKSVV